MRTFLRILWRLLTLYNPPLFPPNNAPRKYGLWERRPPWELRRPFEPHDWNR